MKVIDSWSFLGYTFFKLDENRYTKNIKFIEIGKKRYTPEYPYDSPYCLMVRGELNTDMNATRIIV